MRKPVQIFPTQTHSYSDVYASRQKTKYRIGRPDGSPMMCYNISEEEAKTILTSLPPELLEVVKKHYHLFAEGEVFKPENLSETFIEAIKEHYNLVPVHQTFYGTGEVDQMIPKTEEDTNVPVEEDIALEEMTRDQLRDICKQLEIKSYGKWSKEEMINAIEKTALESDDE